MFIEKYLSQDKLKLLYSVYEDWYIEGLDEEQFLKIYNFLEQEGFYFIDDVILNYLELFEIDEKYVRNAFAEVKNVLGDNYIKDLGKDMSVINKIMELAETYMINDNF